VHEKAAHEVLDPERQTAGDGAAILALKRLSDAKAHNDPILAVFDQ